MLSAIVVVKLNLCPFFCSYLRRESFSNNIIDISISKSDTIEKAFHAFWEEVQSFYQSTNQISCSVIVFPELQLFGNYELFELFTDRY